MINEGIHDRLKEVYDEFDRHCRLNNIDYSIDADYYNVQAYRLLGHNDVPNVLRHMSNYIKDKWVSLDYDGFPVNYNDLKAKNFNVPTYNPLFKFTLKSLQEEQMNEDQIKGPSNAHGRRQAAFPSSMRKHKTRDTYEKNSKIKKKRKKKRKKKTTSIGEETSFEERLISQINENIGLSMVEPDILLTRNPAEKPENKEEEEEEITLEIALQAESIALQKYLSILERSEDERKCAIVENMIERSSEQIKQLNKLLEKEHGTS